MSEDENHEPESTDDKLQAALNQHTLRYVEYTADELKRLRYWFAGFKAAGGNVPECEFSLSTVRKAQQLVEEYAAIMKEFGPMSKK